MGTQEGFSRARHDIRAKTARSLLLSSELDAVRVRHGVTTRALAEAMDMSPAMVNRMMTGRRVPGPVEIGGLCAVLDVPPDRRPYLYGLARESEKKDWLIHATPSDSDPNGTVRALWSLADAVDTYGVTGGPRVLGNARVSPEAVQARHAEDVVWTHYVPNRALDGSGGELDSQTKRLVRLARLGGVRIIPDGVAPPFRHPVQVLRFRHFAPVVVLDLDYTVVILENEHAEHYVAPLRVAMGSALSAGVSRELVVRLWGGGA
ncbi:helix-turn-helix transcriptional regulator [Actinokineospora sp. PR83]|uniref:helix-turn-helix domain-containing protein n=1 Tax=Actinokineospora sp. PR83 TaxID=2884908 RepID=UPI001F1E93B8|nr:helix-turn-helix transcriptional regulator [Actinokineospora sp. PR83]MCG8914691.1 helix-turn-helix transcriptional regulator [Actinokineospora sp. PR83]